jgi:hypothetical protein
VNKRARDEWYADGCTLNLEAALDNIRQEIADDFDNGRVRPFIEGEVIGGCRTPGHAVHFAPEVLDPYSTGLL